MRPALLLVDLQNDFLSAPGLEPPAQAVVRQARRLLSGARGCAAPVFHAVTSVDAAADDRMPHWKRLGRWRCVAGTPGQAGPPGLAPALGETVVSKRFFSAFASASLEAELRACGADTLIVAGVHLHGCVRATVLDAYSRGFDVWVAEDAVGSDDPLHAAICRRYLEGRAARFAPVERLVEMLRSRIAPDTGEDALAAVAAEASAAAREAGTPWSGRPHAERTRPLAALAARLESEAAALSRQLAGDVGKPVTQGLGEVRRTAELLRRAAALPALTTARAGVESAYRRVPHGVVAAITPWNNPLAIPWGKIGPALALGNAVVWKPAPAATRLARRSLELARSAGIPDGVVRIVAGDHRAAAAVMNDPGVAAVSLSGSSLAGWAAQEICARRRIPLQAELGGNNAAVVWSGADLPLAAERVALGAFAFAGQRCTANRRAIVQRDLLEPFLAHLTRAVAALRWGDPLDPATQIGPLVSEEARDRVAAALAAAAADGASLVTPHGHPHPHPHPQGPSGPGAWHPPTLVIGARHESAIVQDETFGPVLVVEAAEDLETALRLVNDVRQGLAAAIFASDSAMAADLAVREAFSKSARAGILKWNASTADADADAPFGGWKESGIGPPEHGPGNVEFYSRLQTIYGGLV